MPTTASASMASDSSAWQNSTIAWNTNIGLARLSARLVSYVSTKAVVSAFRFVMKHSSSRACRNLPEELLSMIADAVRELDYQLEFDTMDRLTILLIETCGIWQNPSQKNLDARLIGGYQAEKSHEILGVWFPHDGDRSKSEPDQQDVERYYKLLARGRSVSKLAKCFEVKLSSQIKDRHKSDETSEQQIFAQEFGIRPLFLLRRVCNHHGHWDWCIDSVVARAYLTLPTTQTRNESEPDPERVSLYVGNFPSPQAKEASESLTEEQRQRVKCAAKALGLHWVNMTPDAFMYDKLDPDAGTPTPEPESSGGF